jgi:hypothetical protein
VYFLNRSKKSCFWVFLEPGFPFRYFSALEKDSYIGEKIRKKGGFGKNGQKTRPAAHAPVGKTRGKAHGVLGTASHNNKLMS